MGQSQQSAYAVDDALGLAPVPAGTTLLVTGPSLGGTRELVLRLLACDEDEGLLLITSDIGARAAIDGYETHGCSYQTERMAVVDCTQDSVDDEDRNVHAVSTPSDLTGIGIAFSSLYEQFYEVGVERVRTGMHTLAPLAMFTDKVQPLYRFLHTVTGRIRTADGLGVAAIDPETLDEKTFRTLSHPFDGQVQLRERDGTTQIRVRGLPGQPDDWHDVDV